MTTKNVYSLEYLDGLSHFLFGFGRQGKIHEGVGIYSHRLVRLRIKSSEDKVVKVIDTITLDCM